MNLTKNNYSLGFLLVKCQILNPSVYFIHELTGDGKMTSWYVKKVNYLKAVSCVINSILELPCLFGAKEGTRLQVKKSH